MVGAIQKGGGLMYDNQRIKKPRRRDKEPDPAKFWGQVLPSPATTAGPDSFDARVEKALRFMRTMFFTPEEHAAVAEAVVRLVNGGPGAAD